MQIIGFTIISQILGLMTILMYLLSDFLGLDQIRKKLIFMLGILTLVLVPWIIIFYYL